MYGLIHFIPPVMCVLFTIAGNLHPLLSMLILYLHQSTQYHTLRFHEKCTTCIGLDSAIEGPET